MCAHFLIVNRLWWGSMLFDFKINYLSLEVKVLHHSTSLPTESDHAKPEILIKALLSARRKHFDRVKQFSMEAIAGIVNLNKLLMKL